MGGQDGISSPIAAVPDLVEKALPRQLGEALQPVRYIVPVGIQLARPWFPWLVPGFLLAVLQVLGYGTPVVTGMAGNGPNRHSLLFQLMKIHDILQCQHRKISSARFLFVQADWIFSRGRASPPPGTTVTGIRPPEIVVQF